MLDAWPEAINGLEECGGNEGNDAAKEHDE
jgi:hypothetical protein